MAKIVLGVGTSHTPLLTIDATQWETYAMRDKTERKLNLPDGRWVDYAELEAETGGKYASIATFEQFKKKDDACQRALDRVAADLAAASPDVVVVVTDDENELFTRANTPAISIFYGSEILTRKRLLADDAPEWRRAMGRAYSMDAVHSFPALPDFARGLIERLIEKDIDVGAASQVEDPQRAGFGHGVGFVVKRLFNGRKIPVVPILLNTYYPPNVPTPSRCHDMGRALRAAIESSPQDLRVAVLASGGLSHFTVDEVTDRRVLEGMIDGKPEKLRTIPVAALNSGSSEIRNWIAVAGAIEGLKNRWVEYQPLYRTPAGTGIGAAFGVWS